MEQSPFGVILRAGDKEATKAFYEKLGLTFSEHRHGAGPLHYACSFRGAVLEIYQGRKSDDPRKEHDYRAAGESTIYIELPAELSIDQVSAEMKIIHVIRKDVLVVLQDPDGRAVMVSKREEENSES